MRKISKIAMVFIGLWLSIGCLTESGWAQFLSRIKTRYINYGWEDYHTYRDRLELYDRFDFFGNFLMKGEIVYMLEEYRTLAPEAGSVVVKQRWYEQWLRKLVVATDSYGKWNAKLMVGDAIRTTFTPLTLDLARLDGIRFDLDSEDNKFTFVTSRVSDPVTINPMTYQLNDFKEKHTDAVYLLGGRWQSWMGDILKLGFNYASLHRTESLFLAKDNSLKGVAPENLSPPTCVVDSVVVRFSDDSPDVGQRGAAIYSIRAIMKVKEGGKTITITDVVPMEKRSAGVIEVDRHLEFSGDAFVEYAYPIPDNTFSVEFVAVVANDYRISVRQTHTFIQSKAKNFKPDQRSTEYHVVARAEGNVTDFSNRKILRFDYGIATGLVVFGLDFDLNLFGFNLRGEYERNINYYRYPLKVGERSTLTDKAYFVNVKRDLGPLMLGYEYFYLGPKYCTYHHKNMGFYYNDVAHDVLTGDTEGTERYALVDDNDDSDQWPDDYTIGSGAGKVNVESGNVSELNRLPDAGIFPGWDKDKDGVPDNNRNWNTLPDWAEPFVKYYCEPDEFYYGLDLNNNGTIDEWENDKLPDYPYYKDEKGPHYFGTSRLLKGLNLTYGLYDVTQIAGGGKNKVKYGRAEYLGYFPRFANLAIEFDYEIKQVKDSIKNDVYEFRFATESEKVSGAKVAYVYDYVPDKLEMRNSLVHTSYLATKFSPVADLNIINNVKYFINYKRADEFDDGTFQEKNEIESWAMVNKADYTYRYRNLTIIPQIRFLYYKETQKSIGATDHYTLFTPILRFDISLTEKTKIQTGVEGFPFLKERHTDKVSPWLDYSSRSWVVSISNRSDYLGYRIFVHLGYLREFADYDDPLQKNVDISEFFVRVVAGVGAPGK